VVQTPDIAAILNELRNRRNRLASDVAALDAAIHAIESISPEGRAISGVSYTAPAPVTPGGRPDLSGLTYMGASEIVLQRSNRKPLSTKVLLVRLEAGGRPVRGKDPYRTLYRMLTKSPKFRNVSGEWGLAEWYPEPVQEARRAMTG
jgi:hypothetical protein